MRRSAFLAFDEFVSNQTIVYSSQDFNARLAHTDQFSIHVITDTIGGGGNAPTTVAITLDHSGDARLWANKSTPVAAQAFGTNGVVGYESGQSPMLAFARLGVTLGGGNPLTAGYGARVRIYVTQRDQS